MPAAQLEIPGSHARGSACPRPRFSILALDGGGARGYLTAKILEQIEVELDRSSETPMPLGQRFDLIAGTSTGGIIALALAAGLPARTVSRLYTQFVPRIFGSAMHQPLWRRWTHARYRADGLHQALEAIFDGLILADVCTDVCVTAVSLANARPVILHSDYRDGGFPPASVKLAELAMATAAAPTYFVASSGVHFTDLVDRWCVLQQPCVARCGRGVWFLARKFPRCDSPSRHRHPVRPTPRRVVGRDRRTTGHTVCVPDPAWGRHLGLGSTVS